MALAAYHLAESGLHVSMVDKRDVASGSTAASTCLLQYEIDTHLEKLIEIIGKKKAFRSYQLCREAISKIGSISRRIKSNAGFERKKSIYLASANKDVRKLEAEYLLRKEAGIPLAFLLKDKLKHNFNIDAPAALISDDAAQIDAYKFTQELLSWLHNRGVSIFDKTEIVDLNLTSGNIKAVTDKGFAIKTRHVIFAAGYETQNYLNTPYGRLHSTYVVACEPLPSIPFDFMLWESSRPYTYIRTTPDNRIIIGGKDEVFYSPGKRDRLLKNKTQQLVRNFNKYFPEINFIPDYSWTGTFAETKDGLPYIGKHKKHPRCHFALCYGGNGITFSLIAAEIIRDEILKRKNNDKKIFSFYRD